MKVLASDLDGTLYFGSSESKIKPQDIQAIKDFQAAGHLFGICSGRTYAGIHHALDGLDVHLDFYILVSGACLMDADGQVIYQDTLSKKLITRIFEALKDKAVSILFCHGENYYRIYPNIGTNHHAEVINHPHEAPFENYDSLHLAFQDASSLQAVKTVLEQQFQGEIAVHHNVLNLDITPAGHSKGQAIMRLADYLNCRPEDIAGIGDSYNDISMLKACRNSFTFHSSDALVKAHATHLVDDIAQAIHIIQGEETC